MARPTRMAPDPRILHTTRGFRLKRKQALRAISEGALVWDEVGVSVRDATLQETLSLRAKQAEERDPLPLSEIHGIMFKPPIGAQAAYADEKRKAYEANIFFTKAIQ